jgi:membrane protein implicated in regulation of membrane protease activity
MNILALIYSLTFGFGATFLAIQFFFSFDDEAADSADDDFTGADDFDTPDGTDADAAEADAEHHDSGSEIHAHERWVKPRDKKTPPVFIAFLAFLRLTRRLTYFSAGFGAMGLFCVLAGVPALPGLFFSSLVGIAAIFITNFLFNLALPSPSDRDSRVRLGELVGCYGEVLSRVGADRDDFGEIKISLENRMVTLYATSRHPGKEFARGEVVTVYKIEPDGFAVVDQADETVLDTFDIPEPQKETREL